MSKENETKGHSWKVKVELSVLKVAWQYVYIHRYTYLYKILDSKPNIMLNK